MLIINEDCDSSIKLENLLLDLHDLLFCIEFTTDSLYYPLGGGEHILLKYLKNNVVTPQQFADFVFKKVKNWLKRRQIK